MGDIALDKVSAHDLNEPQVAASMKFLEKYGEEREKRIRADGVKQYIDLQKSEKYGVFLEDPWVQTGTPIGTPVAENGHVKILIVGAGFGGILFAVKLLQAGFDVNDILIVDPAGGFGGTWYWNRPPGLMCDVESYIYLPLLEEMGYIPQRRYASGVEIRQYLESICTKYNLHRRAMFQSSVKTMNWDESNKEWIANITKRPKGGQESPHRILADFVLIGSGVLNNAQLPDLEGLADYRGHMFHTARWDYNYTHGTPETPVLTGLQGKKVGFIGTGATAVQAVPEVARYADKLYVFQRTPSSVDVRDNRDTDPTWWKSNVATKSGWQRERNFNFVQFVNNTEPKPAIDMVDDAWTKMFSYSGLLGGPKAVTMDNVAQHVGELHALDYPRQERIRQRTAEVVKDQKTAQKLKAFYPGWCKRPCFHDEYLQAFNSPNVELIDTNGKGVDRLTEKGIQAFGKEYELDVIIFSTGFRSPFLGSAAGKANFTVTGRNGLSMEKLNDEGELMTLHGATSRGFPNMHWPGPLQTGIAANAVLVLDIMATHIAYIISEATRKSQDGKKVVVEPTAEAQEQWATQIMAGAVTFAGMSGCTPSYLNKEGEVDRLTDMEAKMKAAKSSIWPNGFTSFVDVLENWRAQGDMQGLEITAVA